MLTRGVTQAEVARLCEVSRQTTSSWARQLSEDSSAWRRKRLGRPTLFGRAQRARLGKLLLQGAVAHGFATELWTLARVGKLIEREFGHDFSLTHVWRVLREMGFSSQRPVGRALQRDEQSILRWKQQRWPALKKTPDDRAEPLSSSTNRA